jgi:hypothetical protein
MPTPSGLPTKEDLQDCTLDVAHMGRVVNSKDASGAPITTSTNRTGGVNKTLDALEAEYTEARQASESQFDAFLTGSESQFDAFLTGSEYQFDAFLTDAEQNVDELYQKLGIIELGNYGDLTGFTVTKVNEAFSYNFQSWVIKDESLLPYTLTGSWNADKLKFKQYTFVTNSLFESEVSARQSGDASLQSQINSGISVVFSPQSVIQYHNGAITNSVVIPGGQNAWSFGPTIELANGVSVEIGNNSTWSIQ